MWALLKSQQKEKEKEILHQQTESGVCCTRIKNTKLASARGQRSLSDPQLVSGALIDVAKHLGNLSFRVWEKMKEKVTFSPVILDPNTADGFLYLSDDLTSVRRGDTEQQLPDNPERNTKYSNVFGSEGFSSGKHSWEVEVGDHPVWLIGYVKESVDRKGEAYASPEDGIWCLAHQDGKYTNGDGQTLTVNKNLQKIRVQLDYDRGEVSFYNPEDMFHICTLRDTFTEKLFPYFNTHTATEERASGDGPSLSQQDASCGPLPTDKSQSSSDQTLSCATSLLGLPRRGGWVSFLSSHVTEDPKATCSPEQSFCGTHLPGPSLLLRQRRRPER
uniref:B30.2/SPRY domain-containing protein n=1 Tax=Fundulus heteroclitus TaxID=8078 RepID=A0A3Q2QAW4_FUNHE